MMMFSDLSVRCQQKLNYWMQVATAGTIIMGFWTVAKCFFGISTLMELILSPCHRGPALFVLWSTWPHQLEADQPVSAKAEFWVMFGFLVCAAHAARVMVCAMMCHEPRKRGPCLFPEFFLLLTWISPKIWKIPTAQSLSCWSRWCQSWRADVLRCWPSGKLL